MPIYEYSCTACGNVFEKLVIRRSDEDRIACPACASGDVGRVISRSARATGSRSGGGGRPPPSCGPVG